jgi:hypothetical protein
MSLTIEKTRVQWEEERAAELAARLAQVAADPARTEEFRDFAYRLVLRELSGSFTRGTNTYGRFLRRRAEDLRRHGDDVQANAVSAAEVGFHGSEERKMTGIVEPRT